MTKANEFYTLQKLYTTDWINKFLGSLESYTHLRESYTFQQIANEVKKTINLQ